MLCFPVCAPLATAGGENIEAWVTYSCDAYDDDQQDEDIDYHFAALTARSVRVVFIAVSVVRALPLPTDRGSRISCPACRSVDGLGDH
jgi:hypothetical protein